MTKDEYQQYLQRAGIHVHPVADAGRLQDFSIKAAVQAELLTTKPEWDMYLSWLEEARLDAEKAVTAALMAMSETFADDDRVRTARQHHALARERLRVLTWAMTLPKQAIENGKKASELPLTVS